MDARTFEQQLADSDFAGKLAHLEEVVSGEVVITGFGESDEGRDRLTAAGEHALRAIREREELKRRLQKVIVDVVDGHATYRKSRRINAYYRRRRRDAIVNSSVLRPLRATRRRRPSVRRGPTRARAPDREPRPSGPDLLGRP